jgi:hypothetical protein
MRMRRAPSLPVGVALVLLLAGLAAMPAAAAGAQQPAVSSNWAGYAIAASDLSVVPDPTATPSTPAAFTDVTGGWVEPKAHCQAASPSSGAAFWVGLGGADTSSTALEQVGTEVDCAPDGSQRHSAWWEILPSPAVPIRLRVAPGDRMSAAVLVRGTLVTLQITNLTRHRRFTKNVTMAAPDLSSAEWIAESPAVCSTLGSCRGTRLADFGTVTFTRAAATGDGHMGTIADPAWTATRIELVPGAGGGSQAEAGTAGAVPTALSPSGRGFGVAWQASVSP